MSGQASERPGTPPGAHSKAAQQFTTPTNQRLIASVASSSLKRVHFSPHNEEFSTEMTPQSSPTAAQRRPQSRSILKRSAMAAAAAGRFERPAWSSSLGSDLGSAEPEVLFGEASAFAQAGQAGLQAMVQRLAGMDGRDAGQAAACVRIYTELCGVVARAGERLGGNESQAAVALLLEGLGRDLDGAAPRAVLLAATKCAGCVLHVERVCAAHEQRAAELVERVAGWAERPEYAGDKAAQQTAAWCFGVARLAGPRLAPLVGRLAAALGSALARFGGSRSAQFECLAALEALLRRAPVAARAAHPAWLLAVLACVASPIAGIRAKAGAIVRLNMPWVAADGHKAEVDRLVARWVDSDLGRLLAATRRLLEGDEHVLAARTCGMVLAVCARHCGARLDELVAVLEPCFGADAADARVAALMQWRCLVYALHVQRQLHHRRFASLVLKPIAGLLASAGQPEAVHVACVRTWATLVYALGEHSGGLVQMVLEVPALAQAHASPAVRTVVCRMLAALLNRFALPAARVSAFVVPQMIVGTTTLAADEGARSLASTHGPFSSEATAPGDHTAVLARYVIGLDAASPTVPVVARAALAYAQGCVAVAVDAGLDAEFGALCATLAAALASLRAEDEAAELAAVVYGRVVAAGFAVGDVLRPMLAAADGHLRPLLAARAVGPCALADELTALPSYAPGTCAAPDGLAAGLTHGVALDLVSLASAVHAALALPDEHCGAEPVSLASAALQRLLDDVTPALAYGRMLLALACVSRVVGAVAGVPGAGLSAVLACVVDAVAAQAALGACEDAGVARLVVGELLALQPWLPAASLGAQVDIVWACRAALSDGLLGVAGALAEHLHAAGRLPTADEACVGLFVVLLEDARVSPADAGLASTCLALLLRLLSLAARHHAGDPGDVPECGVQADGRMEDCLAVLGAVERATGGVEDPEARLAGVHQLVRGVVHVLHVCCVPAARLACRPFGEPSLPVVADAWPPAMKEVYCVAARILYGSLVKSCKSAVSEEPVECDGPVECAKRPRDEVLVERPASTPSSIAESESAAELTESSAAATPRRKKKKRTKRRPVAVTTTLPSDVPPVVLTPAEDSRLTVEELLAKVEEQAAAGLPEYDLHRLLAIQGRLADVNLKLCDAIKRCI
ncbi:hypothetical protein GGI15_003854 [Coemansia interrupta]|uniref:Telomere-associated protein Rif1 N-terminal domain-containing protein n=1 Tax=Coemansia interrupta TaxID=1126814 RepID=A0A9W8HC71_9FUNG|nr:hypothetical protein GGI15_003854 [Coemansia interrupta]